MDLFDPTDPAQHTPFKFPRPDGAQRERVFVTSDEHYGHRNIIGYCERPFSSVEEMDEVLIARHNAVVHPWDTTYHLGDFALGDWRHALAYLERLNGHHVLISGNHDKCFQGDPKAYQFQREFLAAGFVAVMNIATIKLPPPRRDAPGRKVVLSHFPYAGDHKDQVRYAEFRPRDEGGWLVHGHVHELYTVRERGVNVGVDRWDFTPVEASVVAKLIDDVEAGRTPTD